jgi:hypothetical protein
MGGPPDRAAMLPFIKWFQSMIRRRPFLIKHLENVLVRLLLSLEFYGEEDRGKVAMAMARIFSMKASMRFLKSLHPIHVSLLCVCLVLRYILLCLKKLAMQTPINPVPKNTLMILKAKIR